MPSLTSPPLHQQTYSLDHAAWVEQLATTANLLIIQDLDGVCMELVNDPLDRVMDLDYLRATQRFDGHFFVLTNGEHTGRRGVNSIVDRTVGSAAQARRGRYYLPGLAAGGVQWQSRSGEVSHPGVSPAELAFLAAVPEKMGDRLRQFFQRHPVPGLDLESALGATVLDNLASPTVNLNTLHAYLRGQTDTYIALQRAMAELLDELLAEAAQPGLAEAFFVHYAPNHGRGPGGQDILWLGQGGESGTTDFQFMVRGAIKEAGVLALLNRYYAAKTGRFPLGEGFSVRQAPSRHDELLDLVVQHFDPALMPTLVGVGDTVTSAVVEEGGGWVAKRGGSDRNFLHLIQAIGQRFGTGNLVTYVDSSGGQLKNRRALKVTHRDGAPVVTAGPGDPRDTADPLVLNVVFPGGHRQYCRAFQAAAERRTHIKFELHSPDSQAANP